MNVTEPCRFLDWDSSFFGRRIARVEGRLSAATIEQVFRWRRDHCIDALYYLCDAADTVGTRAAEQAGFNLTDIRMTLSSTLTGHAASTVVADATIRSAQESDITDLQKIAAVSHRITRYYRDGHFPEALCDRLYETWIENSFRGYAHATLVADVEGRVAGYITVHLDGDAGGHIGLCAVHSDFHGRGLGRQLVAAAVDWFAAKERRKISVIAQGANITALKLYQKCGFFIERVEVWYHKWFLDVV